MYKIETLENGFEYIVIENEIAFGKIALQGAHLFEYRVKDKENFLWLSKQSSFEKGSAIRGGIPLCWPRFGNLDRSLPQHGFARTSIFKLIEVKEINASLTEVHLQLKSNEETEKIWPFRFTLELVFEIGETLSISMKTINHSPKEMFLTEAFHTYFHVSDIENISIDGLEDLVYIDTLTNERKRQKGSVEIHQEIDRVYLETLSPIILEDQKRKIFIETKGCASTIVWNPWIQKCSQMSAMEPNAYRGFVCIESANAFDNAVTVASNKSHEIKVVYSDFFMNDGASR